MYEWTDGAYLMHHGIKGQKWGIRRFQNEDGSYTNAGKERRLREHRGNRRSNTLREARRRDINSMTTKELKEYNDRLQAEQNFKQLTKKKDPAIVRVVKTGANAAAIAAATKLFASVLTAETVKNAGLVGLGALVALGVVK